MKKFFKLVLFTLVLAVSVLLLYFSFTVPRLQDFWQRVLPWRGAKEVGNISNTVRSEVTYVGREVLTATDTDNVDRARSEDNYLSTPTRSVQDLPDSIGIACSNNAKIVILSEKDADRILHSVKDIKSLHRSHVLVLAYITLRELEKKISLGENFASSLNLIRTLTGNIAELNQLLSGVNLDIVKTDADITKRFEALEYDLERGFMSNSCGHSWTNKVECYFKNLFSIRRQTVLEGDNLSDIGHDFRFAKWYLSQRQYDKFLVLMHKLDRKDVETVTLIKDVENIAKMSRVIDQVDEHLKKLFMQEYGALQAKEGALT